MSDSGSIIDRFQPLASRLDEATRGLDGSSTNIAKSFFASLPQAYFHHSTPTDLRVLDNDYEIPQPDAQYQAAHSPTMSQFIDAANAEYVLEGDAPDGLAPYTINGRQAELVDVASGLSARVWQTTDDHPQLIVAFSGSGGGDTSEVNPSQMAGQYASNLPTAAGLTSAAQDDALKYTGYIAENASKHGISSDDIFVTGHSLGGGEAEYVAQQTGLGGISFSGQGIAPSESAVGDGSNFISVVNYGDVWGSLASDVEGVQPLAAEFDSENGVHPHWGNVVMVGDVQDQIELSERMSDPANNNGIGFLQEFNDHKQAFHYPGNQALNLGVELSLYSIDQDAGAEQRGEVFDVADQGIGEVIAANAERDDYHDASLPEADDAQPDVSSLALADWADVVGSADNAQTVSFDALA
ncbi:hypothetical protein [Carnimonas bestiolae]|uniref:hypothetical protein n=1 Tax=Carnimonas bestiolae TaxID=3402172 RepID=UPI003EDBE654